MFRNPQGKILRHMFDHAVIHGLDDAPAAEKGYIFLLMSASGMPAQPDGSYATNGSMRIQFPDLPAAFDALRSRGYLAEPNPPEATIAGTLVPELKELLRAHNLPVSGKRAELIDRLLPALSEDEFAELAEKHRICYPSALGFEMIYSLYDLWERRQIDLIDALQSGNIDQINVAIKRMPYKAGFWDDSLNNSYLSSQILHKFSGVSSPYVTAAYVCPDTPEFYIRKISDDAQQEIIESRRTLRKNIFYDKLAQYRACGAKQVRWDSCGRSSMCDALDGKIFSIDQIPQFPVFPDCTCSVSPIYEPLNLDAKPIVIPVTIKAAPQVQPHVPPRPIFAPLPDPDPALPKKRHTGWIIFGIATAIVIAILLFFA